MNEKEEKNKKDLNKLKQILDYLCEIDMLDFISKDELFYHLYNELDEKYLVDIDPKDSSSFSDDDEVVEAIKQNIIEWLLSSGLEKTLGLELKILTFDMKVEDVKYWYISKMKVDNLETAKKVGSLFELLEDM